MYQLDNFEPVNFSRASEAPLLCDYFSKLEKSVPQLQDIPAFEPGFSEEALREAERIRNQFSFQFSSLHFQDIPNALRVEDIVVSRSMELFPGLLPMAWIHFFSTKTACRHLSLCILATILNPYLPQITLYLTHPGSEIKALIIKPEFEFSKEDNYFKQPVSFRYLASECDGSPDFSGNTLPFLGVYSTNLGPHSISTNLQDYDLLIGFGMDAACIDLAENLLNFGDSGCDANELDFNHEDQRDPYSVGFRFNLKGASYWPEDLQL